MTVPQIADAAKEKGIKEFTENQRSYICKVRYFLGTIVLGLKDSFVPLLHLS